MNFTFEPFNDFLKSNHYLSSILKFPGDPELWIQLSRIDRSDFELISINLFKLQDSFPGSGKIAQITYWIPKNKKPRLEPSENPTYTILCESRFKTVSKSRFWEAIISEGESSPSLVDFFLWNMEQE